MQRQSRCVHRARRNSEQGYRPDVLPVYFGTHALFLRLLHGSDDAVVLFWRYFEYFNV